MTFYFMKKTIKLNIASMGIYYTLQSPKRTPKQINKL